MSLSSRTGSSLTASTTLFAVAPPPPPPNYFNNIGLGYSIAIALGFLVLLSTLLLVSYICCRATRHRRTPSNLNSSSAVSSDSGIILPRIIFVAEDDEENEGSENVVVGLDQAVINSYPRFPFSKGGGNESMCAICLCEYKEAEMLRMLPDCRHYFHLTCIDAWLKLNASCPVCRNSPLPTPLSTPLSEVVPLSQYSDGRNRRRFEMPTCLVPESSWRNMDEGKLIFNSSLFL